MNASAGGRECLVFFALGCGPLGGGPFAVVAALREGGFAPEHAAVAMVPATTSPCDEDTAAKVLRLLDALDDLDDVQNVYSNAEFPDAVTA